MIITLWFSGGRFYSPVLGGGDWRSGSESAGRPLPECGVPALPHVAVAGGAGSHDAGIHGDLFHCTSSKFCEGKARPTVTQMLEWTVLLLHVFSHARSVQYILSHLK